MSLLAATVLALAATLGLAMLPRSPNGAPEPVAAGRRLLAALVVVLPLLYAGLVLLESRDRLQTLRFTYVGKQLAFGPEIPLTAGGSPRDSETYEDLHAPRLGPRVVRLEPADEATAGAMEDVEVGDPVLRLRSPSPIVRIDDVAVNSYPLRDGDRIVLTAAEAPIELVYRQDALTLGDEVERLPGTFARLLKGPSQVFYLPDLLARLTADGTADSPYRSLLHRPRAGGPWRLLIREPSVRIERDGQVAASFRDLLKVPRDFDLHLQIAWGRPDRRVLRTARQDRLIVRQDTVEVRFWAPQRQVLRPDRQGGPLELGLVVPSAVVRRDQLIELEDHSTRFQGLSAVFAYDPELGQATLRYLGDRLDVELGHLYALGEGSDRMWVRLEHTPFPRHLLLDLGLLALFVAVFLGRPLFRDAALAAVLGPVGLLLACRLLFAYRAAHNPPHFYVDGYGEARLALWLVPAGILFGWSLAWLARRPVKTDAPQGSGRRLAALRWPLLGLGVAGLGSLVATRGIGNLPWLAVLPWLAAAVLALLRLLSARPWLARRLRRWQGSGWPWDYRWLVLCGALLLLVRWTASQVGMQETLRLPAIQFRLLWTVLQLPLCAAAFALTLDLVDQRRQRIRGDSGSRELVGGWLGGIAALGAFLVLAFLAVALAVGDTGLLIVHALPGVFGLLLLLAWPRVLRRAGRRVRTVYGAGLVLACLPLLLVLLGNLAPEQMVRVVGWGPGPAETAADGDEGGAGEVVDRAAQLSSQRAQQLFRLYMLANPDMLSGVGLEPSERVAIHYHTLQSYAEQAAAAGGGFASSRLPRHLGITYLSDLVPMVFVLADFGIVGTLALALLYLTVLAAVALRVAGGDRGGRWSRQGTWIATMALLAFVLPSLYMILANLNLVLFTGKNCNLLSLNSVSDVLESAALLGLAAFGLNLRRVSS